MDLKIHQGVLLSAPFLNRIPPRNGTSSEQALSFAEQIIINIKNEKKPAFKSIEVLAHAPRKREKKLVDLKKLKEEKRIR